jgi:hypothetical protein
MSWSITRWLAIAKSAAARPFCFSFAEAGCVPEATEDLMALDEGLTALTLSCSAGLKASVPGAST